MKLRKDYRLSEDVIDCLNRLVRHYGDQTETSIVEDAIREKWDRVLTNMAIESAWARASGL